MAAKKDNISYESAFAELKKISQDLESDAVPVDVLAEKVKRASQLIKICQERLRTAEGEVNAILSQMNEE